MKKVIAQGAEAVLRREDGSLVKERVSKGYRVGELDKVLRKRRTKSEAKLLGAAGGVVKVPKIVDVSDFEIVMDFIDGKLLCRVLDDAGKKGVKEFGRVCKEIGKSVARLHFEGIIHGDLTTSNMIFFDGDVWFIDFGLGFFSPHVENKAVDLHVLKQAFESRHSKIFEEAFSAVCEGYCEVGDGKAVLDRLEKVEKRGRYKGKK